jgi:hypothetical protein
MSHAEFYPYPTAGDALALACATEREDVVVEDHRLLLQGVPEGQGIPLALKVSMEGSVLETVLPESERDEAPVEVLVVIRSVPSRVRRAVALKPEGDGLWTGDLELEKADLFESLELEPVLTRRQAGTETGFATHAGARLAWGPVVKLEIDEPPVPAGGYLEVQWDDFRTSNSPVRKARPGLMYMLDTEPDPPMLWLNSAIEHFKAVAHARGPRGRNIRVRDATFDSIVSQTWTSLVAIVITRLATFMSVEHEADAALESLTEWETRVIHYWAPALLPEYSKGEAVTELAERAGSPELMADLQDRLSAAVQDQSRSAYAFRGLVRLRDNEGV